MMNEGKRGGRGKGTAEGLRGGDGAQRRQTKPMLGPLLYSGAMLGPMLSILEAYHSPPFWGGVRGRGFSFTKYTQTGR
jgi:hypothetical protein